MDELDQDKNKTHLSPSYDINIFFVSLSLYFSFIAGCQETGRPCLQVSWRLRFVFREDLLAKDASVPGYWVSS